MRTEDAADMFRLVLDKLCAEVEHFTYARPPKALRNAEIFFTFMLIIEKSPDAFFESGFYRGRSTMIMLECLKQMGMEIPYFVASLSRRKEIKPLQKTYPNLQVCYKPGEEAIKKFRYHRAGALVDGPKLTLHKKVFTIYNNLIKNNEAVFICQHDVDTKSNTKKFLKYHQNIRDDFDVRVMTKTFGKKFKYFDKPASNSSGNLGALVRRK